MNDLVDRLDAGEPRALPRLLSLVENGDAAGLAALDRLQPRTGQAHVVGVTGPPGAGKSSVVNALIGAWRADGRRVAVLAIDPTSPISGGAVLGDRIRMGERHADSGVFIRSMASRGAYGGLSAAAGRVVRVLDAAGFPLVVVETVGAGQDGVDIAALADSVVVLQTPGLGDAVQAIKAGMLEIGDILVVNKADLPGASAVSRQLRDLTHGDDRSAGWERPIVLTSAIDGKGIADLRDAIDRHRAWLDRSCRRAGKRAAAARAELAGAVAAGIADLMADPSGPLWLRDAVAAVQRRERSAESVAREIVARAVRD
ncbi:MAG TPA: methylmalonyl Co-A mutase-associated GTPase MeaB [Thermomicrobiales bacterium]|nr:methylmalonyl Co-A mutase-associated GTPase MeaB [Thermomicrobiales bacterium]